MARRLLACACALSLLGLDSEERGVAAVTPTETLTLTDTESPVHVRCEAIGGPLQDRTTAINTAASPAGEELASTLKGTTTPTNAPTTSVWAYIGHRVVCTLEVTNSFFQADNPSTSFLNRFFLTFRGVKLRTRGVIPDGDFGSRDRAETGLSARALPPASVTAEELPIAIKGSGGATAALVLQKDVETLVSPGKFYLEFPHKLLGDGKLLRSSVEVLYEARIQVLQGSTQFEYSTTGVDSLLIHYFYGVPTKAKLTCPPTSIAYPSAWPTTRATDNIGEHLSVPSQASQGSMVYCHLQSATASDEAILVDPFYKTSVEPSMYNITLLQDYCRDQRRTNYATDPGADAARVGLDAYFQGLTVFPPVGGGYINQQSTAAVDSECSLLVGSGRRPAIIKGNVEAPLVEFFSNVVRPSAKAGVVLDVFQQIALEPFDYGRLELRIASAGLAAPLVAEIDVGGPVTSVSIECPKDANGFTDLLEPVDTAVPKRCEVFPLMATQTGVSVAPSVTYLEAFMRTFVDVTSASDLVTVTRSLTKYPAPSKYPLWNTGSAPKPRFSFYFEIKAKSKTSLTSFDGASATLQLTWRRSGPPDPATLDYDTATAANFPPDPILVGAVTFRVAFVARMQLGFRCNKEACDAAAAPGYFSLERGVHTPLAITPAITGNGVDGVSFQQGNFVPCWTSSNFTVGSSTPGSGTGGACLSATDHPSIYTIDSTGRSLTLLSSPVSLVPGAAAEDNPRFHFTLQLNVSYAIDGSTDPAAKTTLLSASSSVIIEVNAFKTAGRTQTSTRQIRGSGKALVFCEDFDDDDDDGKLEAWVNVAEVVKTSSGGWQVVTRDASDPEKAVPVSAGAVDDGEMMGTDAHAGFRKKSAGVAVQLSGLSFLQNKTLGVTRPVSLAGAMLTQVGHNNPWYGETAANLGDDDSTTQWTDYNRKAVSITLPEPTEIDYFTMQTGLGSVDNDVTQWLLEGSLDNEVWATLHSQTVSYGVPVARGAPLPYFELNQWWQAGNGSCTSCLTVRAEEDTSVPAFLRRQAATVEACQLKCLRHKGCTHVNWDQNAKQCGLLECKAPPVVSTSATTLCYKFGNTFKYLRFTPLRTREIPIPLLVANPLRTAMHIRVHCELRDAKGAIRRGTSPDYLELLPEGRLLLRSERDLQLDQAITEVTAFNPATLDVPPVDWLAHRLALVENARIGTPNKRLTLAHLVLQKLDTHSAAATFSAASLQRTVLVLRAATRFANTGLAPHDAAVDEELRGSVNGAVLTILANLAYTWEQHLHVPKTRRAVVAMSTQLLSFFELKREVVVAQTPEAEKLQAWVDKLLRVLCYLAKSSLRDQASEACARCAECDAAGVKAHACGGTAYSIRSRVVSAQEATEFSFGSTDYVKQASGTRLPLSHSVVLAAYTLPSYPRAYLNDAPVVNGDVQYVCLLEDAATKSNLVTVASTALVVLVNSEPTPLERVPLAVAMRNLYIEPVNNKRTERWTIDCDSATFSSNVTANTTLRTGAAWETCSQLRGDTASEFVSVHMMKHRRCSPSDIQGCLHVRNEDIGQYACQCQQCSTALGYYDLPSPSGKRCVPYVQANCSSSFPSPQLLAHSQQCTGSSTLKYGRCVCNEGSACHRGVCEEVKVCGDVASEGQCELSGLRYNHTSFLCECSEGYLCRRDVGAPRYSTCVRRSTCASQQEVHTDECWKGSVFQQETRSCVCDILMYCHPTTEQCTPKARCGEAPFVPAEGPSESLCYPGSVVQPALLLVPSQTSATGYLCGCPDDLTCDATLKACTCPTCAAGTCDYTADVSLWHTLQHVCTCPEGRVGASCAQAEPRNGTFLELLYPGGDHAAAAAANTAASWTTVKTKLTDKLLEVVMRGPQAAVNTTPALVRSVYVDSGSIAVRFELDVFPSAWAAWLRHRLTQESFGLEMAATLRSAHASTVNLGNLEAVNISVISLCESDAGKPDASIENCASRPRPWQNCTCETCASGYTTQDGGLTCVNATVCNAVVHCSGRGSTTGLVVDGCRCTCDATFEGPVCETDLCVRNASMWARDDCGRARCAVRFDSNTEPGSDVGECVEPSSGAFSRIAIALVVISGLLISVVFLQAIYWSVKHHCFWEREYVRWTQHDGEGGGKDTQDIPLDMVPYKNEGSDDENSMTSESVHTSRDARSGIVSGVGGGRARSASGLGSGLGRAGSASGSVTASATGSADTLGKRSGGGFPRSVTN